MSMPVETKPICHIDVGYPREYAYVLGVRPSTLVLCGAGDGDTISDDRTAIRSTGGVPAACTCSACKYIAEIMYQFDLAPMQARRKYRQAEKVGGKSHG